MTTLWIRADASAGVGAGHIMRTLAVAEVAREHRVDITYVVPDEAWITRLLVRRGFPRIVDADLTDTNWTQLVGAKDAVLFDGYRFSRQLRAPARERARRLAALDDGTGMDLRDLDVVIRPGVAFPRHPATDPGALVLAGPDYALVREEFRGAGAEDRRDDDLLLTFGGSDVAGLGPLAVELLDAHRPFDRVHLVVGPAGTAARVPARRWLTTVEDPVNLGPIFRTVAAAISAGGSTTWELLSLGTPVALVRVAPNQGPVVDCAVAAGAALDLGTAASLAVTLPGALQRLAEPEVRAELRQRAGALVDGNGALRVFTALMA